MKTMVEFKNDDQQYKQYLKGEKGYIDGYTRGGDDRPYVVVIVGQNIVMCQTHELKVISNNPTKNKPV